MIYKRLIMKCLYTLVVAIFVCFSNYAQEPQLFDNDWYLQKVVIAGEDYFPPNVIGETRIGKIYFYEVKADINFCSFTETLIEYDSNSSFFTLEDYPGIITGDCLNSENLAFDVLHFSVFFSQQHIGKNPFSYTLVNDGENLMLIIENSLGDQAIYNNVLLESPDFETSGFTIYPNPATNIITIENKSHNPIKSIIIYDVLGRLVLEENNPSNQLDISKLYNGLLFLTIETDKGVFIKKIIKQ